MRIANQVVLDEVEEGKFVTMLYLTLDPATGELACSGAGHPEPRVVRPDGAVEELEARLALGIAPDQQYPEARTTLERARPSCCSQTGSWSPEGGRALYGKVRLDRLLGEQRALRRAAAGTRGREDSKAFAGGGLADDSAVVVKKTS